MKKEKIQIKIEMDKWMLFSDWVQFGIGLLLVFAFLRASLMLIRGMSEGGQVLSLIVLLMAFTRLINWVRIPRTHRQEDIVEEIDYVMEERRKKK